MGALDGRTYTSTFGSLGFFYKGSGDRTLQRPGRTAVYQKDKIPYGSNSVIQRAGWSKNQITIDALVKASDEAAWLNAVNTSATLTLKGSSGSLAYLAGIGNYSVYPDEEGCLNMPLMFEF